MEEMGVEGLGGKLDVLGHFADLPGPRQALKVLHPLDEVLLLTLCAVLCGADGRVSVALFGRQKIAFLRRFLPFENGTPSHDRLGLIFDACCPNGEGAGSADWRLTSPGSRRRFACAGAPSWRSRTSA